jgi:prepilin-type N-terminal cleavage/methylation domain-containing protein/prepilin-type processing-associated H-X9-DG protein
MAAKRPKQTGFTLAELLIVIAVIALLAGLLFPVLAQVRERARAARCASHMRQLGTAFGMYAQDYDEVCAPYGLYLQPKAGWLGWQALLHPYTKSIEVLACFSAEWRPTERLLEVDYAQREARGSIGININLFNQYAAWGNEPPFVTTLADLDLPAETVVFADSNGWDWCSLPGGWWAPASRTLDRHHGHANVAFADGHVRPVRLAWLLRTEPNTAGRRVSHRYQPQKLYTRWSSEPTLMIYPMWQAAIRGL